MYQADDPKYDKETGTADEFFWNPDSPNTRHTVHCSDVLMRSFGKGFERFDCRTCGWMSWQAK